MVEYAEVMVLVEGPTEQRFVKQILGPYLVDRRVFLFPVILDKPGQKGGDVKFARAQNDIERHLKQRADTWVTLLVDYYGIKTDWPGYVDSKAQREHVRKAEVLCAATSDRVQRLFPDQDPGRRFIPYFSMHEIEALFFSDPVCLSEKLGARLDHINAIIAECGEPEKINDHVETAPSKRLEKLNPRYKKTTTGMSIAESIGIETMRARCPLFHGWVSRLESLVQ